MRGIVAWCIPIVPRWCVRSKPTSPINRVFLHRILHIEISKKQNFKEELESNKHPRSSQGEGLPPTNVVRFEILRRFGRAGGGS
jgi:hypothetical protein